MGDCSRVTSKEFSLRDPDGYYVTISALSAAGQGAAVAERWPGFMGQRRPIALPSQGGSCRLIADSNRERIAEFRLF